MDKNFHLEVLTPHRKFYEGDVEEIIVTITTGQIGILKGHIPMTAAVGTGTLQIKKDGQWREAFISGGFMEVKRDSVTILSSAVEWPEEIDIARAQAAKERAEEKLRQKRSKQEHLLAEAALKRALMRLQIASKYQKM
ncbi:F-type H+-transporting ATPase subunit epsilon [Thermoanaerobacter thermohydrosulfuricus]|uniref:ATP synthase epsilon chain n=4 Tax=Thermoanaerobacter TaxID=1754 RepID=I8QZQ1_9THEO|nr:MULTISPECIES: F0F1 ATP synthase subunit epsilon [Thermoanaerobacter]HHY79858.1 F0F1 ATP synthase subunit epsilon [Thermoanaerobacter sp.]AEM78200.1 ATP synthase epsilon chain [Thermoanaerobacter wiegelii Rt8.B1]EIW00648.1 ATP synthase, F1 epsilon subunit [Thermoanaerobacter siderophilus SR4]EMT39939.1 ATP synthase, F1 epsilon subunit (delta in mitochondria) [Thermoanaerobacter thermohydrosulfuricus WC1]UZQ83647.1 F0F1 ATP synthase subunit epsilon [Thermoanaerobacter sp. RKWS2]